MLFIFDVGFALILFHGELWPPMCTPYGTVYNEWTASNNSVKCSTATKRHGTMTTSATALVAKAKLKNGVGRSLYAKYSLHSLLCNLLITPLNKKNLGLQPTYIHIRLIIGWHTVYRLQSIMLVTIA